MFDKICIKSKEVENQKIDISFLIDSMLFYGKVIVLATKEEITTLLLHFGEDLLHELIISGRLDLRIRENILGSMIFPDGRYNIGLMESREKTYSNILYQAHRELTKNSFKNSKFADHFSKITKPFQYSEDISNQIKSDFSNKNLITNSLPIYLNNFYPTFKIPEKLEINIWKNGDYHGIEAFSLESNIDLTKINEISKSTYGTDHPNFDFSGYLLTLSESKGDIFISSHMESELVTTSLNSSLINLQFQDIIQKRLKSQENINLFEKYELIEYHTIGESYVNGFVSKGDLLNLLNKADKYRGWLSGIPDNLVLYEEYRKAVSEKTIAEKLPIKHIKFALIEGIGIYLDLMGAGGLGTGIASGLSTIDHIFLDKLMRGWKPNHFIDETLKPLTKKKNT